MLFPNARFFPTLIYSFLWMWVLFLFNSWDFSLLQYNLSPNSNNNSFLVKFHLGKSRFAFIDKSDRKQINVSRDKLYSQFSFPLPVFLILPEATLTLLDARGSKTRKSHLMNRMIKPNLKLHWGGFGDPGNRNFEAYALGVFQKLKNMRCWCISVAVCFYEQLPRLVGDENAASPTK